MALINYNYTRLKCLDCSKTFEIKPGQEIDEIVIRCDCKKVEEPKKRIVKRKEAGDAA